MNFRAVLILLSCLLIFSCSETPTTGIISGNLDNFEGDKVSLTVNGERNSIEVVDGMFADTFNISKPTFVNIYVGRSAAKVYLRPGASIKLTADAKDFNSSLTFEGAMSDESTYLAAKALNKESRDTLSFRDRFKLEEAEFIALTDVMEEGDYDFLDTYSAEHTLSADFIKTEKTGIQFSRISDFQRYSGAHSYYAEKEDFEPSAEFKTVYENVKLDNVGLLDAPEFRNFLSSKVSNGASEIYDQDSTYEAMGLMGYMKAQIDFIDQGVEHEAFRSAATDMAITQFIPMVAPFGMEDMMPKIKSLTSNKKTFATIEKQIEKWAGLAEGKPAPNFEGVTVSGDPVMLSDLKGKSVYIDVWATWCGPCIAEQPALFALEDQYHGNPNLEFMGVSIDEDKEAWVKMINDREMDGTQILATGAWQSAICKDYNINGIPRFILVDSEGKIISADAPRPSSDQIKEILKELAEGPLLTSL